MKNIFCIIILLSQNINIQAQFSITEVANMPVRVSNNSVCEGFIDDVPYVFSFSGIDSTKLSSGIHLKSFKYNTVTGACIQIADLPDTLGKIATAASRIDDLIYISGGYHVLADGSEVSSNKMHRYDILNNQFLSDAANIPVATDDHVQVVWNDSLIYLITGWSNSGNITNVQVYNISNDSWTVGTPVPNNNSYKSFGASGTIINNTIYYFGGASSGSGFGAQNRLRKGVINPADPSQITWSISIPDLSTYGYRMASVTFVDYICWIGGSEVTYNYDGIAYNGSGGVAPLNRVLYSETDVVEWNEIILPEIPMDIRGQARVNDSTLYLAGGMIGNQSVSNKIYKLVYNGIPTNILQQTKENLSCNVFPNPFADKLTVEIYNSLNASIRLFNNEGKMVLSKNLSSAKIELSLEALSEGIYFLQIIQEGSVHQQKIIKRK